MKTIIQHIYNSLFEGRTVNEVTIKDQNNKEVKTLIENVLKFLKAEKTEDPAVFTLGKSSDDNNDEDNNDNNSDDSNSEDNNTDNQEDKNSDSKDNKEKDNKENK